MIDRKTAEAARRRASHCSFDTAAYRADVALWNAFCVQEATRVAETAPRFAEVLPGVFVQTSGGRR